MNDYQFLYWYDSFHRYTTPDKISIIKAKTLKAACGQFIRSRVKFKDVISVDHEVFDITNNTYLEIFGIQSIDKYIA